MDVKQLEYFRAIVDAGTISGAARVLHMTQPPLSYQVKMLEEELQVQLFLRGTKKITLTEAGKTLYDRAGSLLTMADITKREVIKASQAATIHIGFTPSTVSMMSDYLIRFSTSHPDIRFDIHEGSTFTLREQLENGVVDITTLRTPIVLKGCESRTLMQEKLLAMAAAGNPVLEKNKDGITLEELSEQKLILSHRYRSYLLSAFEKKGLLCDIYCECEDARTAMTMAEKGLGIAILPASMHKLSDQMKSCDILDADLTTELLLACKGNTPETIAAAKLGKEKGAAVIILTWLEESEIVEFGDYIIQYSFDASPDHLKGDIDYAGEKTMCALLVAVETLQQTAGYENYDKFYEGLGMITGIIRNARKHVQVRAEQFAETYKDDTVIYTMGSGAGYGAAYMESICIFMEMQWLDSSSIHTGEYFHGPFEITDANRPFMIQISEGSTRELDERALKFLHTYAKRIEVLDAKELGLSTIDASVVDYFNHSLFNNVYPIYNHELAEKKEHPLSTRRYMWKVEY